MNKTGRTWDNVEKINRMNEERYVVIPSLYCEDQK